MIEKNITPNENLVQDNSSVSPETNPMDTVQNDVKNLTSLNPLFDFHAEHNGEACIESLRPEDAHTPNAFRFTIAMLCTIYNVAERTMRDNIDSLLEDEEIAYCDISQYAIPGGNSRTYETSLYNLTVLNRLGMCCFRKNKKAKEVRDKFNDVLVKHETQAQPTIYDYARALIAEKERSDALEAQNKALEAQLDEAIRTKSWIGDKKTATAMGTASAKSKECERLKKKLDEVESEVNLKIYNVREAIRKEYEEAWMRAREWCYKHGLPVSSNEPKWTVSARLRSICASYPDRDPQCHPDASGVLLFPKWACDILDKMYDEDDTFLAGYRTV